MIFGNLDKLFARIEKEYPKLRDEIKNWLNYFLEQQNKDFGNIFNSKISEIEEIKTMFATAWKKELKESYDEGIEEGEIRGIERGKLEGIKEGELKGIEKHRIEIVINSYIELELDVDQIAKMIKSSRDHVEKILRDNGIL